MNLTPKQIHKALLEVAATCPFVNDPDRLEPEVVLQIGTFKIRCLPDRSSVEAVAEKYRKYRAGNFLTKQKVPHTALTGFKRI